MQREHFNFTVELNKRQNFSEPLYHSEYPFWGDIFRAIEPICHSTYAI